MSKSYQRKRKWTGASGNRQMKRSKIPWKKISSSLPKFLDAETSITAAKFGARRLPEMKSLWRTYLLTQSQAGTIGTIKDGSYESAEKVGTTDSSYFESNGCKSSHRHMRRRASSHNSKKHHRYSTANKIGTGIIHDGADSTKISRSDGTNSIEQKSRKARRKPSALKEIHSSWRKNLSSRISTSDNNENNAIINKNTSHWLETHLWHTKRFYMSPPLSIFNNWCIPLGHTNRGSRAALRLARSKSTVQDTTWIIGGNQIKIESRDKDSLTVVVEKICGGNRHQSAPFLLNDQVVSGLEVGNGFFYDLDSSFPYGMIGPGEFVFGMDDNHRYYCNIVADVTILNTVFALVDKVVRDIEEGVSIKIEPIAMIQVRGLEATSVIRKSKSSILRSYCQQENIAFREDWAEVVQDSQFHTKVKNGTIFHLTETSEETNGKIMLISQCPNEIKDKKSRSMNIGVSGWDIWCNPKIASELFLELNQSGACPIGLIESTTIAMEANPPLPVWPRDYPDSKDGVEYWSSQSPEWNLIRYCFEAGMEGGRIKTEMHRLIKKCPNTISGRDTQTKKTESPAEIMSCERIEKVEWRSLKEEQSGEEDNTPIVVIKGSHIAPFIQVLAGWCPKDLLGCFVSNKPKQAKRRPRRKVLDPTIPITLPPLPKQTKEKQKEYCSKLLQSLSMFALIRCHIRVIGKGSLSAGMKISSCFNYEKRVCQERILGFVVAGMFSPVRGISHGLAFISSCALLKILSENDGNLIAFDKTEKCLVLKISVNKNLQSACTNNTITGYLNILVT